MCRILWLHLNPISSVFILILICSVPLGDDIESKCLLCIIRPSRTAHFNSVDASGTAKFCNMTCCMRVTPTLQDRHYLHVGNFKCIHDLNFPSEDGRGGTIGETAFQCTFLHTNCFERGVAASEFQLPVRTCLCFLGNDLKQFLAYGMMRVAVQGLTYALTHPAKKGEVPLHLLSRIATDCYYLGKHPDVQDKILKAIEGSDEEKATKRFDKYFAGYTTG